MTEQLASPCPTCGYPQPAEACDRCEGSIPVVDGVGRIRSGRGFFLVDIVEGFFSLFHASLLLMTKKVYMGKLALAILINLILVVVFAAGILWGVHSLMAAIDWPWEWLRVTAGWMSWPIAVVAMWFLAPTLINAGMTPFLDPIANATEMMLAGEKMKPVEIGFWRGLMAGANAAAQVLMLQVFVLIPVVLLSLIPVVGMAFFVVGIAYSAYLNALVWFEIPVLRRGYGWRYRRRLVRRNWARAMGFGLAFNVGMLVPLFNLLFLGPATAVAASTLYFRFEKIPGPAKNGEPGGP